MSFDATRTGFGYEAPNEGDTNDWWTPPPLVNMLGEFDLDPCAGIGQPPLAKNVTSRNRIEESSMMYPTHNSGPTAPRNWPSDPITRPGVEPQYDDEADPLGFDPHTPGAKLDKGKVKVLKGAIQYFPRALVAVAQVSMKGAEKYAWKGWEHVPDGVERYGDALARHLLQEETEGLFDSDTGLLHAAQVAWNALARLELILRQETK